VIRPLDVWTSLESSQFIRSLARRAPPFGGVVKIFTCLRQLAAAFYLPRALLSRNLSRLPFASTRYYVWSCDKQRANQ